MSKFIDITGQRFNHLVVIKRVPNDAHGIAKWECRCDCGKTTIVRGKNLKTGAVKSCGCLRHNATNKTHNMTHTRIYQTWASMKSRCYNPKNRSYKDYGGRGIKVCGEWINNFECFYDWAVKSGYSDSLTIERINVDGDYCPDNCKWLPKSEQANNRKSCIVISYQGKTQNLSQWCKELGLDYKRVNNRIVKLGMTFEEAITKPVQTNKRNMKARSIYG